MAPFTKVLLAALLLALAGAAQSARPVASEGAVLSFTDPAHPLRSRCHDVIMSGLQAVGAHVDDHSMEHMLSTTRQMGTEEGDACTWERVLMLADMCVVNWKQFNKTLTPSNTLSQAIVNLLAKTYVCGVPSDESACTAIKHCSWTPFVNQCSLSGFYATLVYACKDSPVRKMSICVDNKQDMCEGDARCQWADYGAPGKAICLPSDVEKPKTFAAAELWVMGLLTDASKFTTNWGDCITSQAYDTLQSCGTHKTKADCSGDDLCFWLDYGNIHVCSIKPDKVDALLWGDDTATKDAVKARNTYCYSHKSKDACLQAMPEPSSWL